MQRHPSRRARGGQFLRVNEPEPGEHDRRAGNDKHANPSHGVHSGTGQPSRTRLLRSTGLPRALRLLANEASGDPGRASPSG